VQVRAGQAKTNEQWKSAAKQASRKNHHALETSQGVARSCGLQTSGSLQTGRVNAPGDKKVDA
jgi:hypothetical protein